MSGGNDITRREAVARTALFLGGTLAASSISGVRGDAWARSAAPGWRAGTLTADQSELVATIAEHIIPATDTPGARAAGVHRFVDVILSDYYKADERKRFLDGLAALETRAESELGAPFLKSTPKRQLDLLTTIDAESYPPQRVPEKAAPMNAEQGWFFRRMKELTLLGYYTSEQGAMAELKVNPMGVYRGDIPYRSIGHSWA